MATLVILIALLKFKSIPKPKVMSVFSGI
jgi:hypothetical protein